MTSCLVRYGWLFALGATACSSGSSSEGGEGGTFDASTSSDGPDTSFGADAPLDAPVEDAATSQDAPLADGSGSLDGTFVQDAPASTDVSPMSDATMDSDAAAPGVRRIGRFDLTTPSQPSAEWSASAMEANFSGTSISAQLGGANNYFAVVIDGTVQPVLTTSGASSYALATSLAAGSHHVLVFRRDEAFDEPSAFVAFTFGSTGMELAPPAAPSHTIEVIGDSISAGYGDECTNASQAFSASTENEYIAYGSIAARALDADVHVIAWSGKGMYQNLDGTTTETMPILWQRTIPTDSTSQWDPSQWVPNAVVINLGTNDYNAPGGDPSVNYEATYLTFVTHLRSVYPNAFIFCAIGPLLSDPELTEQRTAVTNVISMRKTAGDMQLQLVEFPTQDCGSDGSGCGCDYHPNAATHQAMATALESAMRSALGW